MKKGDPNELREFKRRMQAEEKRREMLRRRKEAEEQKKREQEEALRKERLARDQELERQRKEEEAKYFWSNGNKTNRYSISVEKSLQSKLGLLDNLDKYRQILAHSYKSRQSPANTNKSRQI